MKRHVTRAGAVLGAFTLAGMAMAPAMAAETVSRATANAVTLSVAGVAADSGTVSATNDGTGETRTGVTEPPVSVLGGQGLLNVGTLAQDALAGVDGLDGVSAACSGIAGDDATVAEVGDSACLTGGDNVGISLANLDLTGVVAVNPGTALDGLNGVTQPLIDALVAPLSASVSSALMPLGELGLGGSLGVVEARCSAVPGSATGTANIVDGALTATLAGTTYTILDLPVAPAPNTTLPTDLDEVLGVVLTAVETSLTATLDDAGLSAVIDPILTTTGITRTQIIETIVADVIADLAPLEALIQVTLNKQTQTAPGAIAVTAIDLGVLEAAAQALGAPLVDAQIANVTCGPNSRLAAVTPPPADDDLPAVPTVVDSGVSAGAGSTADVLVGGGVLLAMLAGLIGYRRLAAR